MENSSTSNLLNTRPNQALRTSHGQMAKLLMALYDAGQTTFTISDAAESRASPPHSQVVFFTRPRNEVWYRGSNAAYSLSFLRSSDPRLSIRETLMSLRVIWPVLFPIFSQTDLPWNYIAW
jgi:hypothetical protein